MSYSYADMVYKRDDETKTPYMVTCVHYWNDGSQYSLSLRGGGSVTVGKVFPVDGHYCTKDGDCYCEGGDTNLDANAPCERCDGRSGGCSKCEYTGRA